MLRSLMLVPLLCVAPLAAVQGPTTLQAKQVAAPASDIRAGVVRLPERTEFVSRSRHAVYEVRVSESQLVLPVGAAGQVRILPRNGSVSIDAWQPPQLARATSAELRNAGVLLEEGVVATDAWTSAFPDRFALDVQHAGSLTLEVQGSGELFVFDSAPYELQSTLSTYELVQGRDVELRARLVPTDEREPQPRALRGELLLVQDGLRRRLALERQGDKFVLALPTDRVGQTFAQVRVSATLPNGARVERTLTHAFELHAERFQFVPEDVRIAVADSHAARIELGVNATNDKVQVGAEVWGTSSAGRLEPAVWLGRMVVPQVRAGRDTIALDLDRRWLALEGLQPPLELRHVRIQDPNTHAVLARVERIALPRAASLVVRPGDALTDPSQLLERPAARLPVSVATPPVAVIGAGPATQSAITSSLMLVHGWCSGGNVWPPAHFTGPLTIFADPNQNRTHDEFAQAVA